MRTYALVMANPWVSGVDANLMALMLAASVIILVAFQSERISRWRLLIAAALLVLFACVPLMAAIYHPCHTYEPWSWEWVVNSCWMF